MASVIRLARVSDVEDMLDIYAPVVRETAISFELEPPTVDAFRQRVLTTLEQNPWLVCETGADISGYAYAGRFRERWAYQWSAEVTVYINPAYRQKGIGRAIYTSLLECLRVQGYYSAVAAITLPNEASVALHESLGFKPLGVFESVGYKHTRWHDVGWWKLPLQWYGPSPTTPRSVQQVLGTPAWDEIIRMGTDLLKG